MEYNPTVYGFPPQFVWRIDEILDMLHDILDTLDAIEKHTRKDPK
jgi:hypothetical protein